VAGLADAVGELGSTGRRIRDGGALEEPRYVEAEQAPLRVADLAVDMLGELPGRGCAATNKETKTGSISGRKPVWIHLGSAAGLDPSEGSAHIWFSPRRKRGFALESGDLGGQLTAGQAASQAAGQAARVITSCLRLARCE
jgi:hypothetical protein